MPEVTEKRCPKCGETKPSSAFARSATRPDGLQGHCKACRKAGREAKGSDFWRDYEMRKRYGIGIAEYNAMLEEQGGVCAICNEKCIGKPNLSVDHNHSTGQVRGLLCGRCNHAIGLLREDESLFLSAMTYLAMHDERAA